MTTTVQRETAKIYQFPAGGRAALIAARKINQVTETSSSARPSKVVYGGNWYHEAEIQDVDPARKR